jgi:lipopolysaccharide export system permease protein
MLFKIWERYFFKEALKVFFLFLICFYGLYVLIDYANHARNFHTVDSHFPFAIVATYYGYVFIEKSNVLIPFAILIATVRTLTKLNQHNELVALLASGISLRRLMRPLVILGLALTCFQYVNEEWIYPHAMRALRKMEDARSFEKHKKANSLNALHVLLEDQTTVLYQHYDTNLNRFYDAYWIRSADDIYRMKYLMPTLQTPAGSFVAHLVRNSEGNLVVAGTSSEMSFPEMKFNSQALLETMIQLDDMPISALWKKLPAHLYPESEKEARAQTIFYHLLAVPWLCLFAVIAPAPFCVRFSRFHSHFILYAVSIFGLAGMYLLQDAAELLGKRQVLMPEIAIGVPFFLFTLLFSYKFIRMR